MELLDMPKKIARKTVGRIVESVFALLILVATGASAQSLSASPADLKKKYPKMAPIDEYLMDRDAEIAMARTAAPEAISKDASVLVLTRTGWETAVKGTNGFVCMVERAWASTVDFPQIWNPKIRGVDCINPAAARSVLPIVYKLTEMVLAGDSVKERIAGIEAAFAKKEIRPLEPGAIGYMMSREAYLSDNAPSNFSHVMVFVATSKGNSEWGGWLPHVPLGSNSYWFPNPGNEKNPLVQKLPAMRVIYIAVPRWSDGTSVLTK